MKKNAFEVSNPDFELSPLTGMTKQHYINLAKHLLGRALKNIKSIDQPLTFPTVPGKTYPQPNDPDWRYRSVEFEALERTFTLAGPLIHVEPDVVINNQYRGHCFFDFLCGEKLGAVLSSIVVCVIDTTNVDTTNVDTTNVEC